VVGSSSVFSVAAPSAEVSDIHVDSPAAGDVWIHGTIAKVRWTAFGVNAVKVDIVNEKGVVVLAVVESAPTSGEIALNVNTTLPKGDAYSVRVQALDGIDADGDVETATSGKFSIHEMPKLNMTRPTAAVSWVKGSSFYVRWSHSGAVSNTVGGSPYNISLQLYQGSLSPRMTVGGQVCKPFRYAGEIIDGCTTQDNGGIEWCTPDGNPSNKRTCDGIHFVSTLTAAPGIPVTDGKIYVDLSKSLKDLPPPSTAYHIKAVLIPSDSITSLPALLAYSDEFEMQCSWVDIKFQMTAAVAAVIGTRGSTERAQFLTSLRNDLVYVIPRLATTQISLQSVTVGNDNKYTLVMRVAGMANPSVICPSLAGEDLITAHGLLPSSGRLAEGNVTKWIDPQVTPTVTLVDKSEPRDPENPPEPGWFWNEIPEWLIITIGAGAAGVCLLVGAIALFAPRGGKHRSYSLDEYTGEWQEALSTDGDIYYFNATTGETSWELPEEETQASAVVLPEGWEAAITEDGDTYYFSNVTGETTWDPPRLGPHGQVIRHQANSYVPSGWQIAHTAEGESYYANPMTGETSWEKPQ
jgi:pre-mRNA-processing factor 40